MANKLQIKRGLVASIPTGSAGEPLFTTDTNDLYIGTGSANIRFQKYIASGATTQILLGDGSLYNFPLAISSPSNGQYLTFNGTSWVNTTLTGTGITTLNTLTATTQTFAVGTSGTDFNISSATSTHTFNIPDAGPSSRGLITNSTQTIAGAKTFSGSSITISNLLNIEQYAQLQKLTLSSGSPSSGKGYIWYNSATNTLYFRNDANVNYDLTANSGGTVTSVAMSVPTGFAIGGTPITSSGTLALSFASGYSLPTTASQTNWDAAYNDKINSAAVTGTTTKTLTLTQQDGGTITASWTDDNTGTVTGSGTTNYLPKWTSSSALGNSLVYDNGTSVAIGITSPFSTAKFQVKTATDVNIAFQTGTLDSSGIKINAFNDLGSANVPMELNASTLFFKTLESERARITSGGNLLVGTTTDSGEKLVVSGRVKASASDFHSFIVDQGSAQIKLERTTTSTGSMYIGADNVGFKVFDSSFNTRLTLTSDGNLGLGVTPSAWGSSFKSFQVGNTSSIYNVASGTFIGNNIYGNSSSQDIYITTAPAGVYGITNVGTHNWYIAPSGTAGNAITFTQAMTLDASGRLLLNTTTADGSRMQVNGRLNVYGPGSTSGTYGFNVMDSSGNNNLWVRDDGVTYLKGNLGLGVTPSAWGTLVKAFQVGTGASFSGNTAATSPDAYMTSNCYYDGAWKYILSSKNALTFDARGDGGSFVWQIAPSGTAGNAITFTQAMTLFATGNLSLGDAGDAGYRLFVNGNTYLKGLGNTSASFGLVVQNSSSTNLFLVRNDGAATFNSLAGTGTRMVVADANGLLSTQSIGSGIVTGTGTTNYLPKWTSSSALGDSLLQEATNAIGLGITPSSWDSGQKVLQVGYGSFYGLADGGATVIASNAYYNSGWKYSTSTSAALYQMVGNTHQWNIAIAGTAGNAISFTQAMTLDASGRLGIATNPVTALSVYSNDASPSLSSDVGIATFHSSSSVQLQMGAIAASPYTFWLQTKQSTNSGSSFPLALNPSGGNVLIGTTTDGGYKLDVAGTGRFGGSNTYNGFLIGSHSNNVGAAIYNKGNATETIYADNSSTILNSEVNLYLRTGNTDRLTISNTGAATFSSSVNVNGGGGGSASLNVQQASGASQAVYVGGIATAGSSNGINILAGTNSSDYSLRVASYSNNPYLFVRGDGNVGIGTSSPSAKLTISGVANGQSILTDHSSAYSFLYSTISGANPIAFDNNSGNLIVYVASGERLRVKTTGQLQLANYQSTTSFSGTVVGYLAFDASGNVLTTAAPGGSGTVTSVATSAPLTGGTITTSGTIGITQATTSTDGYLSSTDWNTFNGKQSALTNPVTGTGTNNYISKFTSTGSTIGNSLLYDNGTAIGLGTTSLGSTYLFDVNGGGRFKGDFLIGGTTVGLYLWPTSSSTNGAYSIKVSAKNFIINDDVNLTERLLINDGGKFSINNTRNTYTFDIEGDFRATTGIKETRIDPRSITTTSTSTLTPDVSADDFFTVTAQAATITLANPIGTPVDGQKIIVRIKDNGTSRTIQYGTEYRGSTDLPLPTATTISKTVYLGFIYNSADTKWDLIAQLDNF